MKKIGVCLSLVLMKLVCVAQTQDSVVHPIVTVSEERISQAVGTSTTETDTLLYRLLRSKGLTQVLQAESFISTRAYQPGGTAIFSVRGSGPQHTQVVWEGVPINDPMLGLTDLSTISLGGVEGVRVLYGGAGLTNNAGGIGGTIELLSTKPRSKDGVTVALNGVAGSFGTYGMTTRLNYRYNKWFGNTSFEYQTAQNNFKYRNLASIAKEDKVLEHAAVKRIGFSKKLGLRFNEKNSIEAAIYFAQVHKELPPSMLMVASIETLFDRDVWAAVTYRRIGTKSVITTTAAYTYGNQQYFDNNEYSFYHLYQASKNLLRYKLNLGYNLQLEAGADAFAERARSDSAYRYEPHWRFWQAGFASVKYVPRKWVAAQVLVREDVIDGKFSPIQGLASVEVKPTDWLSVKTNVARNFRAATLNDLYWVPGGNPDLKNETGFNAEAGVGIKTGSQKVNFNFGATYFYSKIDNWVVWLPEGNVWTPQNKREVEAQGIEAQSNLGATIHRFRIQLHGAYSWVSSRVTKGASANDASVGNQLIYVPEHQANAHLSVHFGKLFLLYGHQFTGLRYTTSDNQSELPHYQLSYVSVGYEYSIKKHSLGVNLTIDNLFNKEYQSIAWRPMPGRSFLVNLNYQFN